MYTLCPNCNHSQKISRRQLKKRSQLTCSKCKQQFIAYTTLSEMPPIDQELETFVAEVKIPETPTLLKVHDQAIREAAPINQSIIEIFDWQKTTTAYRPERWLIGIILGLFLLAYQVYYFKGYSLSQNPQIRPWLTTLSSYINYPLPDYRKPLEFTTIGSSLERSDGDHYRLQVSFINHADFPQAPPYIQLTLQNLYGGVFAQRIFSPQQYLGKANIVAPIKNSATLDVDFLIATPEQDIGGYSIELR